MEKVQCRFIETSSQSGSMNMSIDEALLDSDLPVLRFYTWNKPTLSLGHFQKINEINQKFCKEESINIVRRLSGGQAVLHDNELTYSLILPSGNMTILETYKKICDGLFLGLDNLGIKSNIVTEKCISKDSVCYFNPSQYEIKINNKKLIGSAQKRIKNKILQHGSIPITINYKQYSQCFTKEVTQEYFKSKMTSISEEINIKSIKTIKEAIAKGLSQKLNLQLVKDQLTKDEKRLSKTFNNEKYSNEKWTLKI